ncbi:MAG: PEP-CTERM sorting domain-containing protein [Verrucomicrobiaceae bacterium]|nr:PEP-CTERM sorting domain-containing protein [Verrucomicrobiaceae bacterium]
MAKKFIHACFLFAGFSIFLSQATAYTLIDSKGTLDLSSSYYLYPQTNVDGSIRPPEFGQDNFSFYEFPFVSQSVSKTVQAGVAFASGAVSYATSADAIDFHLALNSQYYGQFFGGTSISSANGNLVLDFSLESETLLELIFSPRNSSPPFETKFNFYDAFSANILVKLENWDGTAWTTDFSAHSNPAGLNTDHSGVYFTNTIGAGHYRFSADGYASQGSAIADGAIRLTPVPEPSGMLLLMIVGCLLLCRRSTRSFVEASSPPV